MHEQRKEEPFEVTITAPSRDWLKAFVRQLVEDRLAAAAHVDVMETTYRWDGVVNEASEARAILHTSSLRMAAIEARLAVSHTYEVPCLAGTRIVSGSAPYLSWVLESAKDNVDDS